MTVRPSAASVREHLLDPGDAARVLAGRRLVQDDDRRVHGQHGRDGQQLASRVAQVVRVRIGARRTGRRPPGRSRVAASTSVPLRPRICGPNATSVRTLPAKIWRSGFWNTIPTRAASAAVREPGHVLAVVQDAALGRSQQPVEVPDERRLAAPVLADDRDRLARRDREVDAVERARAVGVDEADALEVEAGHASTAAGSSPRDASAPATAGPGSAGPRPRATSRASSRTVAGRPVERRSGRRRGRRPGRTGRRADRSCARR